MINECWNYADLQELKVRTPSDHWVSIIAILFGWELIWGLGSSALPKNNLEHSSRKHTKSKRLNRRRKWLIWLWLISWKSKIERLTIRSEIRSKRSILWIIMRYMGQERILGSNRKTGQNNLEIRRGIPGNKVLKEC